MPSLFFAMVTSGVAVALARTGVDRRPANYVKTCKVYLAIAMSLKTCKESYQIGII